MTKITPQLIRIDPLLHDHEVGCHCAGRHGRGETMMRHYIIVRLCGSATSAVSLLPGRMTLRAATALLIAFAGCQHRPISAIRRTPRSAIHLAAVTAVTHAHLFAALATDK